VSETTCPRCGEPVEPRQLVCTNCGGRVALGERAPFGREPLPAAAVVLIVVTAMSAFLLGLGISDLTGDGDDGGASRSEQVSATTGRAPAQATETTPEKAQAPAVVSGSAQARDKQEAPRRERGVPGWPKGLKAHTVVLVTSSDRAAALNVAKEARATGLEAGLMPSDPYDLGTGLWIVYSGQFTTPEGAQRQAAQLAERYPGAYPQLVQSSQ
jgi:DNA-directed RNA polymerase subunit RPC12/RpoP